MYDADCARTLLRDLKILNASAEVRQRFWDRVEKSDDENGCWLFGNQNSKLYGNFHFGGQNFVASRISLIWFLNKTDPVKFACHMCRNRNCVRPEHLYFGTPAENMADRKRDGTDTRGDRHPMRSIDSETALKIRHALMDTSRSAQSVAKEFGVTRVVVKAIGSNRTWAHIKGERAKRGLKGVKKVYDENGHPQSVLKAEQVIEIRRGLAQGITGRELAKRFNVKPVTISAIKARRLWPELVDEQDGTQTTRLKKQPLSEDDVAQIKKVFVETGGGYGVGARLARQYQTSLTVISYIKKGKTFAHVEPAK